MINREHFASLREDLAVEKKQPIALIPAQKDRTLGFREEGRDQFTAPEYDFAEIITIEDTEAYFARSIDKKSGLMFKEGYSVVSRNEEVQAYMDRRMAEVAFAQQKPMEILLKETGRDLVRFSNAMWLVVRNKKASSGRIRTPMTVNGPGKPIEPIAAFFILPMDTIEFKRDDAGKITKVRQVLPDGRIKDFAASDIIHFYINKKTGWSVGTPSIIPVIDDIRTLRRIEENIDLLVYQNLFPLFQYKVGTEDRPVQTFPDGTSEIDVVRAEISYMPPEGVIVTPERHEIQMIGSEGRALRAESYLAHFKTRVLSGLSMSSVDVGEGACYTADTETLTENGWRSYSEISDIEKIATFNPDTELVEFQHFNFKYIGNYNGPIVHFSGQHIDIAVTPHHDMWVASQRLKTWNKISAIDILKMSIMNPNRFWYIRESSSFVESGSKQDNFFIETPKDRLNRKISPDVNLSLSDYAEFLGYFISEGCVDRYNAKQGRYRVLLSQNKGAVLDNMTACITRMGLPFRIQYRKNTDEAMIIIYSKGLALHLLEATNHGAKNKKLPDYVMTWDKSSRQKCLNALIDGDGSYDVQSTLKTYYTSSKQLRDDVQILAMSLGYLAKVTTKVVSSTYRVYISKGDNNFFRRIYGHMVSLEEYNGVTYCYTVPNHLFVTRRNGKVAIQGNTVNRATATTLSGQMIDAVKAIQEDFAAQFNFLILNELLLEGSFKFDPLLPENAAFLSFKEIDLDKKVLVENHLADIYSKHLITEDEARLGGGYDKIPLDDERRMMSYMKLVQEPTEMIKGAKDPTSPLAHAAGRNPNTAIEPSDVDAGQANAKAQIPARPPVKSSSALRDNLLRNSYNELIRDLQFKLTTSATPSEINSVIDMWGSQTRNRFSSLMTSRFTDGVNSLNGDPWDVRHLHNRNIALDHMTSYVVKLTNMIKDHMSTATVDNMHDLMGFLDIGLYRLDQIYNSELAMSYNLGRMSVLETNGARTVHSKVKNSDTCQDCNEKSLKIFNIDDVNIDVLPPHHPNCKCEIVGE